MRICLVAFAFVAALTGRAHAADIVPTDADRAAFTRGIVLERAVNVFQNPQMCGIVLLRDACANAIEALFAGEHGDVKSEQSESKMLEFARTGNRDAYDSQWGDINSLGMAEGLPWASDPRGTWLQCAGSAYMFESDFSHSTLELFNLERLNALAKHAPNAGPYDSLVPPSVTSAAAAGKPATRVVGKMPVGAIGLNPDAGAAFSAHLMPELATLFPQPSFAPIDADASVGGALRLGIYIATSRELLERSATTLDPSSRAFLSQLAAAESKIVPLPSGMSLAELQAVYSSSRDETKVVAARDIQEALNDATIRALQDDRKQSALVGVYAAQGAFNAAILRETAFEGDVRGMLAVFAKTAPAMVGPAVSAFLATKPGDWPAENAALANLVHAMLAIP